MVLMTLRGCTGTEHECQHEAWKQCPHAHRWHPSGVGITGLGLGKTCTSSVWSLSFPFISSSSIKMALFPAAIHVARDLRAHVNGKLPIPAPRWGLRGGERDSCRGGFRPPTADTGVVSRAVSLPLEMTNIYPQKPTV